MAQVESVEINLKFFPRFVEKWKELDYGDFKKITVISLRKFNLWNLFLITEIRSFPPIKSYKQRFIVEDNNSQLLMKNPSTRLGKLLI